MPNWEKSAARATRRIAKTFGHPGIYFDEETRSQYPVTACVEYGVQVFGETVEVSSSETHICFSLEEVPHLKEREEDAGYDRIQADGKVWKVVGMIDNDGFMIRLQVREDHLGLPDWSSVDGFNNLIHQTLPGNS